MAVVGFSGRTSGVVRAVLISASGEERGCLLCWDVNYLLRLPTAIADCYESTITQLIVVSIVPVTPNGGKIAGCVSGIKELEVSRKKSL
jgi:hypothetical protein